MRSKKKKDSLNNFPCKCGHLKKYHGELQPYYPLACLAEDMDGNYSCLCWQYTPDNLEFFRQKYKQIKDKKRRS